MKRVLVRYKTKPDEAKENQRLIEAVFDALGSERPQGLRYFALKQADNTFLHFATTDDEGNNPLLQLEAFKRFQTGIKQRLEEPVEFNEVTIVGDYRALSD
jgi:hypothetical protein